MRLDQRADVALNEPARRIVFLRDVGANLAVGADRRHALEVPEIGMKKAVRVDDGRNPRQEHALKIALHDGRQSVEPDREDQDERVCGAKALDIGLHFAPVLSEVDIGPHLSGRENGIETLPVEVEIVHVVAASAQRLDCLRVNGGQIARFQRMGIDDKNPQRLTLRPVRAGHAGEAHARARPGTRYAGAGSASP